MRQATHLWKLLTLAFTCGLLASSAAWAQNNNGNFFGNSVGGITVDTEQVLKDPELEKSGSLGQLRDRVLQAPRVELAIAPVLAAEQAAAPQYAELQQILVKLNSQWKGRKIPFEVLPQGWTWEGEVRLLQTHLRLTEEHLRRQDVSDLPEELQQARAKNLDYLNAYWKQGVFPKNIYKNRRIPVFIDHRGVYCAVGQLMADTGHADVAKRVADRYNLALVREMAELGFVDGVVQWQQNSGFTLDELALIQPPYGGGGGNQGFFGNAVGGVAVDADGVLRAMSVDESGKLREARREALQQLDGQLAKPTKMRMISLAGLRDALQEAITNKQPIPQPVLFLGGLQRIEYVFLDKAHQDIILAGPAEPWAIDEAGEVVGANNGHPILQMQDLVTALRLMHRQQVRPLSVSIDPTAQGVQQLQAYLNTLGGRMGNPRLIKQNMEKAYGLQQISFAGLPGDTRIAHILATADYKMKQLAMGLERSPVRGLTSYMQMARPGGTVSPRWWMAPDYDKVKVTPEKDAWHLTGPGVKVLTEETLFNQQGRKVGGRKADVVAQRFAESMTKHYPELAEKMPIFANLQGCMDLAIAAALISKEQLGERAGFQWGILLNEEQMTTRGWEVPAKLPARATLVQKGRQWVVSVSGGVNLDAWQVASTTQTDASVSSQRDKALDKRASQWWWDY